MMMGGGRGKGGRYRGVLLNLVHGSVSPGRGSGSE